MVGLTEIVNFLDSFLEVERYKNDPSWNGLQVEGKEEVKKVLGCVSLTRDVANFAVTEGFDMIITHHGIFWKNSPPHIKRSLKEVLKLLISNDISVYASHFPLDFNSVIGNWKFLLDLIESNVDSYAFFEEYFVTKIILKDYLRLEEILSRLKYLNVYKFGKSAVKRVVSCCGDCSRGMLNFLLSSGESFDCVFVGEVRLPLYQYCMDNEVTLVEVGHYFSETYGIRKLLEILNKKYGIYVQLYPNPLFK